MEVFILIVFLYNATIIQYKFDFFLFLRLLDFLIYGLSIEIMAFPNLSRFIALKMSITLERMLSNDIFVKKRDPFERLASINSLCIEKEGIITTN